MSTKFIIRIIGFAVLAAFIFVTGCAPVTISSVPAGAEIYDKGTGEFVGETPATINIFHSDREFLLKKPGYFAKSVKVKPVSPKKVEVTLKAANQLLLISRPAGAKVYIPGENTPIGRMDTRIRLSAFLKTRKGILT